MKLRIVFFLFFVSLILSSCEDQENKCAFIPNTTDVEVDLDYESLSETFTNVGSKDELVELLGKYPVIRDYFLRRGDYPDDSVFINAVYSRYTNPSFDTLLMETKRVFNDETWLRSQFEEAFRNLKYYYPEFEIPKIQTVITGFDTDLFVSDTLLIVGLDYFLGPGAKYRPNMYEYLLQQYRKENIVPSFMLMYGIDSRINKIDQRDKTVLADMIAYGKSYYFAKQMMPCTPDSILIWYTSDEIDGAQKNQDAIWYRLIENEVLYSTNNMQKQKFLSERPKTVEVGEKCPGRIGQWVGWQIVKSYAENNEVSLQQLMQTSNSEEIFKKSKYKPEKN